MTTGQVVQTYSKYNKTHFVSGLLNTSTIVVPDLAYSCGIVHIVDDFLSPPQHLVVTLDAPGDTAALGAVTAAQVFVGDTGNLTESTGYLSNITFDITFTAFIANNSAFKAVGSVFVSISQTHLVIVVGYHMVPKMVACSSLLTSGRSFVTLFDDTLIVTESSDEIFTKNAEIILPNVIVSEGVVHIIDKYGTGSMSPQRLLLTNNQRTQSGKQSVRGIGLIICLQRHDSCRKHYPFHATTIRTPSLGGLAGLGYCSVGSSGRGLSTGAKAGITVGAALSPIAAAVLTACLIMRRKRPSRKAKEIPQPVEAEISPPERDLAPELPSHRDLATELPSNPTGRKPIFLATVTENTAAAAPSWWNPYPLVTEAKNTPVTSAHGRHEVEGRTVDAELVGRTAPILSTRGRHEIEGPTVGAELDCQNTPVPPLAHGRHEVKGRTVGR